MDASQFKRLKEMAQVLAQMKRMYAELVLENQALEVLIEKSSKAGRYPACRKWP